MVHNNQGILFATYLEVGLGAGDYQEVSGSKIYSFDSSHMTVYIVLVNLLYQANRNAYAY